jgi:hypothetical protein
MGTPPDTERLPQVLSDEEIADYEQLRRLVSPEEPRSLG